MSLAAVDPNGELTPHAHHWIEQTLARPIRSATSLAGGRNNRAFRIDPNHGESVLFKAYFRSDADPRDRLHHEFTFSEFAWKQGIRRISQPLAQNPELHAALYAFVPGRRLTPPQVTHHHVGQAIDFFRELHADPMQPAALALPLGSEACFTNIDHVALVDQRIRALDAIADPAAAAFLERELKPYWASIHPPIAKAADAFTPTPTCLSPSDFGFHNAILRDDDDQLTFHDFEYAGQDDPAKLLGDFFHQPRIPAPGSSYGVFEDAVVETLQLDDAQRVRFRTLLPVYRAKWCGIVLAPLLPQAAERRKFAGIPTDPPQLIERASHLLHQPFTTSH